MYEARLTFHNGTWYSQTFQRYETMVAWLAAHPAAGLMVWEDGEAIDDFAQLQRDVEALQP